MLAITLSILAAKPQTFEPARIPFASLDDTSLFAASGSKALESALKTGIFQLTNIPEYADARTQVLALADECESWSLVNTFKDGTTRRTLASHTLAGPGGVQPLRLANSPACDKLAAHAKPFRLLVDDAVRLFARRLSGLLSTETPLLATAEGYGFDTFDDVVESGEHLEHIHAYTRPASTASEVPAKGDDRTLELHTDQGLFIAFTPALIHSRGAGTAKLAAEAEATDPSAFLLTLPGGEVARASFDSDALVFMLGDGVQQIVSPKLRQPATTASSPSPSSSSSAGFSPRPVPHALSVARTTPGQARLWYGRMVLPPSTAVVEGTKLTFGEMRSKMSAEAASAAPASEESATSLGCASTRSASSRALAQRHLELLAEPQSCIVDEADAKKAGDPSINGSEGIYCWWRCMPLEMEQPDGEGIDATDCEARNLTTQCVDIRGYLAPLKNISGTMKVGYAHGDFLPGCTSSTEFTTDHPIPAFADPPQKCFPAAHDEVAETTGTTGHGHRRQMMPMGGHDAEPEPEPATPSLSDNEGYAASVELICEESYRCRCFAYDPEATEPDQDHDGCEDDYGGCDHDGVTDFEGAVDHHQHGSRRSLSGGEAVGPTKKCVVGKFMWTVRDGEVDAKLISNGPFGWLGFGFQNPGGGHNGMEGGHVVMAIPGDPTSFTGKGPLVGSPNVDEYIINEFGGSAFRFWNTPYKHAGYGSLSSAGFAVDDCDSSMTFTASAIAGQAFNLDGTDEVMWATNVEDAWVSKHDRRGAFTIRWADGIRHPSPKPPPSPPSPPPAEQNDDGGDWISKGAVSGIALGAAAVGALIGVVAVLAFVTSRAAPAPPCAAGTATNEVVMAKAQVEVVA